MFTKKRNNQVNKQFPEIKQEELYQKAARIFCFFTILFTAIGVSIDTIPVIAEKRYVNLISNILFILIQFLNIFLVLKSKISIRSSFSLFSVPLLINIVICYFEYIKHPDLLAGNMFRDVLLLNLMVFVASFIVSSLYAYMIATYTSVLYVIIAFWSNDKFLLDNIPITVMIVFGIAFTCNHFAKMLFASFNKMTQAANQIEKLSRFKQEMTQMIIHDLKVPLNAMINIAGKKNSLINYSKNIGKYARQMLNHVLNILDINKLEEVGLQLGYGNHNINEMILEVANNLNVFCDEKKLHIEINSESTYFVHCDRAIILRVIENIVSNAIKHSPVNEKIKIDLVQQQNNLLISITDVGQGMSSDEQKRIFSKFYSSGSTKHSSGATGLGLTFCKLALDAHKQTIHVKSEPGKGTVFSFKLEISDKNNLQDESQFIISTLETLELTEREKKYLTKNIQKLRAIPIHQTSEIFITLNEITAHAPVNIQRWVNEIQEAAFTCNKKYYEQLTDL